MKSPFWFILMVGLILSFLGCSDRSNVWSTLNHAEALMEEDPKTAFNELLTIDTTQLKDTNEVVLYSLLYYQLAFKNNLALNPIYDLDEMCVHLEKMGNKERLMRGKFIKGVIEYFKGDYNHSLVSGLEAEAMAEDIGDTLYMARSCEHLSDVFNVSFNPIEQLYYVDKAANLYAKIGKTENHLFSLVDKAKALFNCNRANESIILIDSLMPLISSSDTILLCYALETRANSALQSGNNQLALEDIERVKVLNQPIQIYPINTTLEYRALLANHQGDKAISVIQSVYGDSLDTIEDFSGLMALCDYNKQKGDYQKALAYYDKAVECQNSRYFDTLKKGLLKAQTDYYETIVEKKSEAALHAHQKSVLVDIILILLILFLTVFGVLCYYYFKAQRRERLLELQEKISIIEELDNTLQSKEDSLAQMQSILDSKDIIIDNLKKEITLKKNEILSKELEISNRDIEITSKEIEISTKVQEISNKDRELSNKDRELSNKDRELSNKDLEISSKDEEISSLGRKFQDIYAEHFEILNRLVAEYRNKKNRPEKVKLAFFADMEKEFQKLQSPIHIADLEKLLETYHGHIVTKLKEAIPDIKKLTISSYFTSLLGSPPSQYV